MAWYPMFGRKVGSKGLVLRLGLEVRSHDGSHPKDGYNGLKVAFLCLVLMFGPRAGSKVGRKRKVSKLRPRIGPGLVPGFRSQVDM